MRLIDADNLEECKEVMTTIRGECKYAVRMDDIRKMPTITVERPHGEWIKREDMDYLDKNKVIHKHFECNKCGFIHVFICGHTAQYNFCPNCGAKMKEGEEE